MNCEQHLSNNDFLRELTQGQDRPLPMLKRSNTVYKDQEWTIQQDRPDVLQAITIRSMRLYTIHEHPEDNDDIEDDDDSISSVSCTDKSVQTCDTLDSSLTCSSFNASLNVPGFERPNKNLFVGLQRLLHCLVHPTRHDE